MRCITLLIVSIFLFSCKGLICQSNVQSLHEDVFVEHLLELNLEEPIRLVHDPVTNNILFNLKNGDIYSVDPNNIMEPALLHTSEEHGLSDYVVNMLMAGNDILLASTTTSNLINTSTIIRGVYQDNGTRIWETIMITEPYAQPNSFNHRLTGIALSPNGNNLFFCIGSRTDHGEIQDKNGNYPELREDDLTTNIYKIALNQEEPLILQNDKTWLKANNYLFAEGVRNHFDLAFNSEGQLFGVENSGTADDSEEINWIRKNKHYGFPWRMGGNETPMQFVPYTPEDDPLLQWDELGDTQELFYEDPTFPSLPADVNLSEGIRNFGPDADLYINTETGELEDASDENTFITSLSSHRSPLGLVFDTEQLLSDEFNGDAFVLSFTASNLLLTMDESQDLLHVSLWYNEEIDNYDANIYRLVSGFNKPIDAIMVAGDLYVLEYGDGQSRGIWKITLPKKTVSTEDKSLDYHLNLIPNPIIKDGIVQFSLNVPSEVKVNIYNSLGQIQYTSTQQYIDSGSKSLSFETDDWAPGIYFCNLKVTNQGSKGQTIRFVKQ